MQGAVSGRRRAGTTGGGRRRRRCGAVAIASRGACLPSLISQLNATLPYTGISNKLPVACGSTSANLPCRRRQAPLTGRAHTARTGARPSPSVLGNHCRFTAKVLRHLAPDCYAWQLQNATPGTMLPAPAALPLLQGLKTFPLPRRRLALYPLKLLTHYSAAGSPVLCAPRIMGTHMGWIHGSTIGPPIQPGRSSHGCLERHSRRTSTAHA